MKKYIALKDIKESQSCFQAFKLRTSGLCGDMEEFIRRKASSNENFSFGEKLLDRIQIVFDWLRADREGNWNLHLDAFQRSLDEFAAWDCTICAGDQYTSKK